jgi:hypothetical protein
MRKIIPYIIKLSVVLMALSVVGQQVSATKGDVEHALELLRQARAAIGGEANIGSVQSLAISGKSRRQLQLPDQSAKELNGEFELNMLLPDKLMRMEKLTFGTPDGAERQQISEDKQVKIVRDAKVKIVRGEMDGSEAENNMRQHEQAEIAHYMLGLLLTPPASLNATYNYVGEGEVEGTRAEIIEAQGTGGFNMKIYLDKSSHLPLMMAYQGSLPRIPLGTALKIDGAGEAGEDIMFTRHTKEGEAGEESPRVVIIRKDKEAEAPVDGKKFTLPAPAPVLESAWIEVRFSDFRTEGGVLLPHTLTEMINGKVETVWTVDRYDINSPSINEKFQKDVLFKARQN